MCLGIPGKIISLDGNSGVIEVGKVLRKTFMHLVFEAKIGDYVVIHAGCAIQIIDEEEASKAIELLEELTENEIYR